MKTITLKFVVEDDQVRSMIDEILDTVSSNVTKLPLFSVTRAKSTIPEAKWGFEHGLKIRKEMAEKSFKLFENSLTR
jgi:predicted nucleic-acid-binding protein